MKNKTKVSHFFDGVNKVHVLVLLLFPILLYAQSFQFNFVYHDDDIMILQGASVLKQFNLKQLLLRDAWLMDKKIELYRPWQSITYAIDYALGGSRPFVYHVHNVLVFALGVVLFYFVLLRLQIKARHAFFIALLYSTHSLFANAVCWIPARGDLYLFLFSMLALWLWLRAMEQGRLRDYVLTAVVYGFALFSKESAIALIPIFAWLYYAGHHNLHIKHYEVTLFVVLSMLFTAGYLYLRSEAVAQTPDMFTLGGFLYNIRIIPEQLGKFFIPAYFSVMPAYSTLLTLIGTLLIVLITALCVSYRKGLNRSWVITGALLYLLPSLPAVMYKPQFTGFAYDYLDHRLLLPATGLMLIAYSLITRFVKKQVAVSYLYVLIGVMAAYTYAEARNYKDYKAYYTNATRTNPKSGLAWMNFGTMAAREDDYTHAFAYFYKAKEVVPDNVELLMKIADSHMTFQQWPQMIKICKEVMAINPKALKAYYNIADYFVVQQQPDSMRAWMQRAYLQDSSSADYYYYYGYLYKHLNVPDSSIHYFGECIKRNNQYALAYYNRGSLYGKAGKYVEARDDFARYIALDPEDPNGFFFYGQALCASGDTGNGCYYLKEADKRGVKEARDKIAAYCK